MSHRIALFGREADPKWVGKISVLMDSLANSGVQLCYYEPLFRSLMDLKSIIVPNGPVFNSYEDLPDDISLFLALGGDGTFLNSLTFVRDKAIPVAGVNFGRLGFLTSVRVSEDGPNGWMEMFADGLPKVEERPLLHLVSEGLPDGFYPYALNEITIQRKEPKMMGIGLSIDGMTIPTYWADGLLVATNTGSTAYSLSVGGPIVTPGSDVFIIAPMAPHNLNVRPLIVSDRSSLTIKVLSESGHSMVSVDNRFFDIDDTHTITISKADFGMKYVPASDSNFFDALCEKLLWGLDKRNK